MKYLLVGLMLVVGAFNAIQAPVIAGLSKRSNIVAAVTLSFIIGAAIMLVITAVTRSSLSTLGGGAYWEYLGGVTSLTFILTTTFLVTRIGLAAIIAANVAAQLAAGMAIDRFGLFGLERIQVSWVRVLGGVLLLAGALMVARK